MTYQPHQRGKIDLAQARRDAAARERWLSHQAWNLAMHASPQQKEQIDQAMQYIKYSGRFR